MKYFKDISTLEDLRRQYKELLKKYHPDNANGSTAHTGSSYNANMYDWENDKALREVLQKIINFDGIEITICGQWLWISGNTYSYKKELKEIGFKWASNKRQWYFHTDGYRKRSRKSLSMDDIRNYYGSTKVQTDSRVLLEA